jgi:glycosyltransferase involved in cell wall biosynthesis
VDVARFRPDADRTLIYEREPDIPRNRPLIFALGKFIERKGFSYLIDALACLDEDQRPFLMLGGRGPLKEELRGQVRRNQLSAYVKFLDYIPDGAIAAYHAAADLFVLPSIVDDRNDTEGLGVVLLEALACGTPCVASRVGGITDVIQDGCNGLLVAPQDARQLAEKIGSLLADDALRRRLGRQGRQFVVENFAWQKQALRIRQVYESLLPTRS